MPTPRVCCVDKTQYVFCPRCGGNYNPNELWRNTFCSENCKSIYETCNSFAHKKIDASEAKKILSRLDVSKLDLFPNGIKANIVDILGTVDATPVVEPVIEVEVNNEHEVIVEEPAVVVENEAIEEVETIPEESVIEVENPVVYKRRNRR